MLELTSCFDVSYDGDKVVVGYYYLDDVYTIKVIRLTDSDFCDIELYNCYDLMDYTYDVHKSRVLKSVNRLLRNNDLDSYSIQE